MKKLLLLLSISALFLLSGCSKVIKTETNVVEAIVSDTLYKSKYVCILSNTETVEYPEKWITYLEYEDKIYRLPGKETYEKCKDILGSKINCNMLIEYYENGAVHKYITQIY